VPTRARNVSAVALRLPQRGEVWLFDCGEATQHQIQRTDLRLSQITRVFITHLHGDHVFGLPGLLASIGMAGAAQPVTLYGPAGLKDFVLSALRSTRTTVGDGLAFSAVRAGVVYEDGEFVVSCLPLRHRLQSFGYRVQERDRAGRFDVERATGLGIPPGPLYGRLKRGETVTLPDGRAFDGRELCGPDIRGRSFVYCTDTTYCENSVRLSRGADLLVHEATFVEEDAALARQSTHSTAADAARVAREAGVRRLAVTHVSPRYAPGNAYEISALVREARAGFPATTLAEDFMTIEIERDADEAGGAGGREPAAK
jgi:ribonuclease Z